MRKELFLSILPSVALAANPSLLFRRQDTTVPCSETGEKDCGTGCIDLSWTCCPDAQGGCPPTEYCILGDNNKYGCCPVGEDCGGPGGASTLPGGVISGTPSTLPITPTTSTSTSEATPTYESSSTSTHYGYTTSTIYTTTTRTITSCAPTVTSCPAHSTAVVTETIALSTTVCPVTETPSHTSKSATYYPPTSPVTYTTFYPTATKNTTAIAPTSSLVVVAGATGNFGTGSTLQLIGALMAAVMMF